MRDLLSGFEVFKSGSHQDRQGRKIDIDIDALKKLVRFYRPKLSEAPIVVGHPEDNHPAFGWIQKFKLHGDRLLAYPAKIDQALKDAVNKGHYRKISMSFYHPQSAENPKPGIWYPRHVGFLGAAAPAVKGLKNVQFASNDVSSDWVEFAMPLVNTSHKHIQDDQTSRKDSVKNSGDDAGKKPVRHLLKTLASGKLHEGLTLPQDFLQGLQNDGLILPAYRQPLLQASREFLEQFIRADNDADQIMALGSLVEKILQTAADNHKDAPEFSETANVGINAVYHRQVMTGGHQDARLLGYQIGTEARKFLAHQCAKGNVSTMVEAIQHAKNIMRRNS